MNILLAEDNLVNQEITKKMLELLGHRADTAINGAEVLEKINTSTYDIIFMDCEMPILNGFETTKKIRSNSSQKISSIKIIALTASDTPSDIKKCIESGMDFFLSKPLEISVLKSLLESIKL